MVMLWAEALYCRVLRGVAVRRLMGIVCVCVCVVWSHVCEHDEAELQRLLHYSGMDVVVPEASVPRHGANDGRRFHVMEVGSIRIGVSVDDLFNESRVCAVVGQTIPDFKGGLISCDEEVDVLTVAKRDLLINTVLPRAIAMHSARLHVRRLTANLSVDYPCAYFSTPAAHLAVGVPDVDFIVYVAGAKIASNNTIAWAGACQISGDGRPTVGKANFAPRHLLGASEAEIDTIVRVGAHELAHAMGFSAYFFEEVYPQSTTNFFATTVREKPATVVNYTAPVQAARAHFACNALAWVELEDEGGSGTRLSHWERRNHFQDLMSGISGDNLYSKLTMSMFEASGNYFPNYALAEAIRYGNQSGCSFLTEQCFANSTTPSIRAHFCNDTSSATDHQMCTFNRKAVGVCYSGNVSNLPSYFQYFTNDALRGGLVQLVDRCPMVAGYSNRQCDDSASSDPETTYGTYYGVGGRCVETQQLALDGSFSNRVVSCLRLRCLHNGEQLQIRIGTAGWVDCPRDGAAGIVAAPAGYHGSVVCPVASLLCSDATLHYATASATHDGGSSTWSQAVSPTLRRKATTSGSRTLRRVVMTASPTAPTVAPTASTSWRWPGRRSMSHSLTRSLRLGPYSWSRTPLLNLTETQGRAQRTISSSNLSLPTSSNTLQTSLTTSVAPSIITKTASTSVAHSITKHRAAASRTPSLAVANKTRMLFASTTTSMPRIRISRTMLQLLSVTTTASRTALMAPTPTSNHQEFAIAFEGVDGPAPVGSAPMLQPSTLSFQSHNFTLTLPQGHVWQGVPIEGSGDARRLFRTLSASGAVVRFQSLDRPKGLEAPKGFVALVNATAVRCVVHRSNRAVMRCVLPPVAGIYLDSDEAVLAVVSAQFVAQAAVGKDATGAFVVAGNDDAPGTLQAGRVLATLCMAVNAIGLAVAVVPPMPLQSLAILRESPCASTKVQDDLLWLRFALSPLASVGLTASVLWNVVVSAVAVVAWVALFIGPGLVTEPTDAVLHVPPRLHAVVVLFHGGVTIYAAQIAEAGDGPAAPQSGVGVLGFAYATISIGGFSLLMLMIIRVGQYVSYDDAVRDDASLLARVCGPCGHWHGGNLRHMFLQLLQQAGRATPGVLFTVLSLLVNAIIGVLMGLTPDSREACAQRMYGAAGALYLMSVSIAVGRPCRSTVGTASLSAAFGSVASLALLMGHRWDDDGRAVDRWAAALWVLALVAHFIFCVQHIVQTFVERRWVLAAAALQQAQGGGEEGKDTHRLDVLNHQENDDVAIDLTSDGVAVGPSDGHEMAMLIDLGITESPRVPTPESSPVQVVDTIDEFTCDEDLLGPVATSRESKQPSPTSASPPVALPSELEAMFEMLDTVNVQL